MIFLKLSAYPKELFIRNFNALQEKKLIERIGEEKRVSGKY